MSKFTPGPWRIGKGTSVVCNTKIKGGDNTGHNDEIGKDFYGGYMICESVLNEADKNLIAAAQEMYEALEAIEFSVYDGANSVHHGYKGEYVCPKCLNSKIEGHDKNCCIGKALAKADGRGSMEKECRFYNNCSRVYCLQDCHCIKCNVIDCTWERTSSNCPFKK